MSYRGSRTGSTRLAARACGPAANVAGAAVLLSLLGCQGGLNLDFLGGPEEDPIPGPPPASMMLGTDTFLLDAPIATGSGVIVGNPGFVVHGLAFDPNTTTTYGTDGLGLYTIDPLDGSATLVGAFTHIVDPLVTGEHLRSLAFDPVQSKLYGLTNNSGVGGALYLVDTTSGATTLIGEATNQYLNWNGLAYDANLGLLYALASTATNQPDVVFSINTTTGAAVALGTPVGDADGPFSLVGLAVDSATGYLHSINRFDPTGAPTNVMYRMDPFTLAATPIGGGTGFVHLTWALAPQQ